MKFSFLKHYFKAVIIKSLLIGTLPKSSYGQPFSETGNINLVPITAILLNKALQDFDSFLPIESPRYQWFEFTEPPFDFYSESSDNDMGSRLGLRLALEVEIITAVALWGNGVILLMQEQGWQLEELPNICTSELYRITKQLWSSLERLEMERPDASLFTDQAFLTDESLHLRMTAIQLAQNLIHALEINERIEEEGESETLGQIRRNRIDIIRADINEAYGLMARGEFDTLTIILSCREESQRSTGDDTERKEEGGELVTGEQNEPTLHNQKEPAFQTYRRTILKLLALLRRREIKKTVSPGSPVNRILQDRISLTLAEVQACLTNWVEIPREAPDKQQSNPPQTQDSNNAMSSTSSTFGASSSLGQWGNPPSVTRGQGSPQGDPTEHHTYNLHCPVCLGGACELIKPGDQKSNLRQSQEMEVDPTDDTMDLETDGKPSLAMEMVIDTSETSLEDAGKKAGVKVKKKEVTAQNLLADFPDNALQPFVPIENQPENEVWSAVSELLPPAEFINLLAKVIEKLGCPSSEENTIDSSLNLVIEHLFQPLGQQDLFKVYQGISNEEKLSKFEHSVRFYFLLGLIFDVNLDDEFYHNANNLWQSFFEEFPDLDPEIIKLTWELTSYGDKGGTSGDKGGTSGDKGGTSTAEQLIARHLIQAVELECDEKIKFIAIRFKNIHSIFTIKLQHSNDLNTYQIASKKSDLKTLDLIRKLIGNHQFKSDIDCIKNHPCLFFAIDNNDMSTLKFLVESGVNINIKKESQSKITPLIYAIQAKKTDIICYLLQNETVDLSAIPLDGDDTITQLLDYVLSTNDGEDLLNHFKSICPRLNEYLNQAKRPLTSFSNKFRRILNRITPTTRNLYEGVVKLFLDKQSNNQPSALQRELKRKPENECEFHHPIIKSMNAYWEGVKFNEKNEVIIKAHEIDGQSFRTLLPKNIDSERLIKRFVIALNKSLNTNIEGFENTSCWEVISYLNKRFSEPGSSALCIVGGTVRNAMHFAMGESDDYSSATDIDIQTNIPIILLAESIKYYLLYKKKLNTNTVASNIQTKMGRLFTVGDGNTQGHIDFYSSDLCSTEHRRFCDFTINYSFVILMGSGDFFLVVRDYESMLDIKNKKLRFNKNAFEMYKQIKINPSYALRFIDFKSRGYIDCHPENSLHKHLMWVALRSSLVAIVMPKDRTDIDNIRDDIRDNIRIDDIRLDDSDQELVLTEKLETIKIDKKTNITTIYDMNLLWLTYPYRLQIWVINKLKSQVKVTPSRANFIAKLCSGSSLSDKYIDDFHRFDHFSNLIEVKINENTRNQEEMSMEENIMDNIPDDFKGFPKSINPCRYNQILLSTPKDMLQSICQFVVRKSYKPGDLEGFLNKLNKFLMATPCQSHYGSTRELLRALINSASKSALEAEHYDGSFYTKDIEDQALNLLELFLLEPSVSCEGTMSEHTESVHQAHQTIESFFSLFLLAFAELEIQKQYDKIESIQSEWNDIEDSNDEKMENPLSIMEGNMIIEKYANAILKHKDDLSTGLVQSLNKFLTRIK